MDDDSLLESQLLEVSEPEGEFPEAELDFSLLDSSQAEVSSPATIWPHADELRALLRCANPHCVCNRDRGPVHCPAPDCAGGGRYPCLRLRQSEDGRQPLWHCTAGCSQKEVTGAIVGRLIFEISPHATQAGKRPLNANFLNPDVSTGGRLMRDLASPLQRGLTARTYAEFGLQYFIGVGVKYPSQPNSHGMQQRLMGMYTGQLPYQWLGDEDDPYSHRPAIYNREVLERGDLLKSGLFLVPAEADVWIMQQNGLAAVSLLCDPLDDPEQNYNAAGGLVSLLRNYQHYDLTVLCEDTPADRARVEQVLEAFRLSDTEVQVRALIRTDRFAERAGQRNRASEGNKLEVGDLFAACRFERERFRDAITTLPTIAANMVGYTPESFSLQQMLAPESGQTMDGERIGMAELFEHSHQIRAYDEHQLRDLPRPVYAVQGLVPQSGVTFLTGKHSLGKSAIILDMAASVSLGLPWQNKATGDQPALVFYIAAESFASVPDRLAAWRLAHSIESTPLLRFISHAVLIHEPEALESLVGYIRGVVEAERLKALANGVEPPKVGMVVIDTLACSIGNMEENSPSHMTAFTNAANKLSDLLKSSVVIVHHHGKNDEVRGASSLSSNASAMLTMSGRPGGERVTMEVTKMKEGKVGEKIPLRMRVITLPGQVDDYGEEVTSVVFELDEGEASGSNDGAQTNEGASLGRETSGSASTKSASLQTSQSKPTQSKPQYSEKELTTLEALKALSAAHEAGEGDVASEWTGASNREWEAASQKLGVARASYTRAKAKLIADGLVICTQPNSPQARFLLQIEPEEPSA